MGPSAGQAIRDRGLRLRQAGVLARGDGGGPAEVLDHESATPDDVDAELTALFAEVHATKGDSLVAFGWAMEEDLRALG